MTSFPISPEFKLNGELSSQVGKRELFFLKKMVILKDLFVFSTASDHNLSNYWTLKMVLRSRDLRVTYTFCVARDFQIKFRICEKFPWVTNRQSIMMLKHRELNRSLLRFEIVSFRSSPWGNAVIWLVRDTYPNAGVWSVQATYAPFDSLA